MGIIFILIGIVALISLYDYFSAKNWQQVTSSVRNEVVFEKRNKEYGAYVIRRDYNKRMILIMFGMLGSVGVACAAYAAVRSVPEIKTALPPTVDVDTVIITFPEKPDVVIPEIDIKDVGSPAVQQTQEFVEMVIVDDREVDAIKPPDEGIAVGVIDLGGKDPFGTIVDVEVPLDGKGKGGEVEIEKPKGPFMDVDEEARFPGGKEKMIEFLTKNLKYPEIAIQMSIEGKCYLQFVVSKDGEISNVKVIRELDDCPECGREAKRVISKMPKWKPGKVQGEAVDSYFQMPINFKLSQ